MEIRPETNWIGSAHMRFQISENKVQAVDCLDAPSQGQYIAPMAIPVKQSVEQDIVGFRKSPLELHKPMVRNRRDGFCSSQHSRSQAIDRRGVSKVYNLHHLSRAERGDGTPV